MRHLDRIIEAAIFAAPKPLSLKQLLRLFPEDTRPEVDDINETLERLVNHYEKRGIHLVQVASGYRFQVSESCSNDLQLLFDEKPARYSRALLETLALIAYRQPITRAEVEDVRGVVVSTNIVKTLLEHEWVRIVGHKDVPGRPALFATTKQFLDHFNLTSLEDLPALSEIVDIEPLAAALEDKQDDPVPQAQVESSEEQDSEQLPDIEAAEVVADEEALSTEAFSEVVIEAAMEAEVDAEVEAELKEQDQ